VRPTILGVLSALLTGLLATVVIAPATPAAAARRSPAVLSRQVVFEVENTNATSVLCAPDNGSYQLRGRLVGPRRDVLGHGGALRVDVLVHDLATGSWLWHLRSHPAYDYATRLAERGETSLVLDRRGYGASPLGDGDATCLGAQADMLHQVVQHLRSGSYEFTAARGSTPAAAHVVTQGHAAGAAIAQVEAATFDDVDGLVLMSWTDHGATALATRTAARQNAACGAAGIDYAPYAATATAFRELFFASAPSGVQEAAAARRAPSPCGDATSVAPLLLGSSLGAGRVEAPVLLLFGGKDALNRADARGEQARSYGASEKVTSHTIAGAGSALPLERSAAQTRAIVLRWLG
jgi:hypothetical protein